MSSSCNASSTASRSKKASSTAGLELIRSGRRKCGPLRDNSQDIHSICMASPAPRVAYFPDSFHEINGVAHTSRQFEAFIRRHNLPFLCIRAGNRTPRLLTEGHLTTLELSRGPLSFGLEKDLSFDLGFFRHMPIIARTLRSFRPDLIHIT